MDTNLRNTLVDAIHRRAIQLAKITDRKTINYTPDTVIAFIAQNLVFTLVALLGESLLRQVLEHLFGDISERYGICRYCRKGEFVEGKGMCEACWKEMETEDEELKREEMMARMMSGRKM